MKKEVISAANFLVDLLRINNPSLLNEDQLQEFRENVSELLWLHYQDHWFPDKPMKGSGYRCIRINGKMDPLIERAGQLMGLAAGYLRRLFPTELTMWVDPSEVAYRIGENGSICNLYVQKPKPSPVAPTETTEQEAPQPPPSPVKSASPQHLQPSSPQLTIQQIKQQQLQQFSPSKVPTTTTSAYQYQSPPSRSPVPSNAQQLRAQQQQLAMFLMSGSGHCKDSLRNSSLDVRGMERLFVSS